MNNRLWLGTLLLATSLQVSARDITREVVESKDSDGAYAELGFSLVAGRLPLVGFNDKSVEESDDTLKSFAINFEGRFQYHGLFIEAVEDSFSNLTLGYNIYDNDTGSLEFITTNLFGEVERSDLAGLETIEDRDADLSVGFRSSHYIGNNVVQLELVGDVSDAHGGVVGAAHIGRQKQILNWNLFGLVGMRYFSDRVADHLFGISSAEATAEFPEYEAEGGFMPSIQLGASLPLSEKWLFKARASYSPFPDFVTDSPLSQGDSSVTTQLGVSYVFGGK